jgi:hypothetical protein
MKKYRAILRRLLLLTLSMSLLISFGACSHPTTPPDVTPPNDDTPPNDQPPKDNPSDPSDPSSPEDPTVSGGRYNPHASRTEGQTSITLREYSVTEGTLLQPEASAAGVPAGLSEVINQYMTHYDALGVDGTVTTFQTSSSYQDSQRINTEAVMAYVSVPSQLDTVIPSWYAAEEFYSINIMMPINRDSHDYVTRSPEHFDDIQTDVNGNYITHSTSDKVYYMVPTERWTEYIWEMVEHILETYPVDSITFEEPEMWYASGYSESFKREWKEFYGEAWQPQTASPEAMLKTMRLKVYLFDRLLSDIADRMHTLSPDTKLYVASHSTASYTSIAITAGLNSYLATGKIDGVIGQTWSNTASVGLLVDGATQTLEYENAYLGYASYAGASKDLDLFAITDAMSDTPAWTEEICFPKYRATLVSALMQPEIHRFEASVWPSRGFVAVSSNYRTLQLSCFEALNEMSGKAITTSAGTPGITYLLSDSLSWQAGSWSLSAKDSYYGVTLPLVSDGIPVRVQSMENIKTAQDLANVTLLLLSWDCQKPLSEDVVDAIAAWILDGGTALYVGGHDAFAESKAEWWAAWGSPLEALFDKLGATVRLTTPTIDGTSPIRWIDEKNGITALSVPTKYNSYVAAFECDQAESLFTLGEHDLGISLDAGKGTLIAVGLPSAMFSQQAGGTQAMQDLVAYVCNNYTFYEYAPTTLAWTRRGRIIAAHSFADDNVLVGSFINLFDPELPIVDHIVLNARQDALLCDISKTDLSIPRLLFSGGAHAYAPVETANKTVFCISGPNGTVISSRLACADGLYPQSITAKSADGSDLGVIFVWDSDTDSLLVQIQGSVDGATVTVEWGEQAIEDTPTFIIEELSVKTNEENLDASLLFKNTGGANANFRYADGTSRIIYQIDLTKFRNATISMEVLQNYLVSYSTDNKKWTVLADYSKTEGYTGTLQGGGNNTIVSVSAAMAGNPDILYIRIADCNTYDGWGGTIKSLTITYQRYEHEPPVELPKPDQGDSFEGFEPTGVDYDAKYPNRQKITLNINANSTEDAPFIIKDSSAANAELKYTDLSNEIIYRFDLSEYKDAVIVATVSQNYFVQISRDGNTWTTIQDYAAVHGGRIEGGSNKTTVGAAAERYAPGGDTLYLRFANADTGTGWGTALSKLEIYYIE